LVEDSLERLTERLREQVLGKRDWPAGEKDKVGEKLRPRAEQEVRLAFLLRAVAQTEKIEVNQQDMEAEKAELLKSAQSEEDRQALARHFEENTEAIKAALLDRKVVNFLKSSAAVTEA